MSEGVASLYWAPCATNSRGSRPEITRYNASGGPFMCFYTSIDARIPHNLSTIIPNSALTTKYRNSSLCLVYSSSPPSPPSMYLSRMSFHCRYSWSIHMFNWGTSSVHTPLLIRFQIASVALSYALVFMVSYPSTLAQCPWPTFRIRTRTQIRLQGRHSSCERTDCAQSQLAFAFLSTAHVGTLRSCVNAGCGDLLVERAARGRLPLNELARCSASTIEISNSFLP